MTNEKERQIHRVGLLCALLAMLICVVCWSGMALAGTTVTLASSLSYDCGTTTIRWDVSGSEPGETYVIVENIDYGDTSQAIFSVRDISGHRARSDQFVPGHHYRVTLMDGQYNSLDSREYVLPWVDTFQDGKLKNTSVKISIETRKYTPEKGYKKNNLSAAAIKDAIADGYSSEVYGVKYQMRMPTLGKERNYFVTLVFESPFGFIWVERATDITFERVNNGYQTLWWELVGGNFFSELYDRTKEIPTGKYQVHLFWDGMWVNTSTFKVGK